MRFCSLLALLAVALTAGSGSSTTRVTLHSDGWVLIGDFAGPAGAGRAPAVLLLHGAARDRRAYIPLQQELTRRGIASLRLDLRGEGESTNLGRFVPGVTNTLLDGAHRDIAVALDWLARQPGVDPGRIGALGASFSGEALARAARDGHPAAAYVALSPGDFSDESVRAIDGSGRPWWFIASRHERFAGAVVAAVPSMSRTARVSMVEGTSHASDILSPHFLLNAEIADWFAARLRGRTPPAAWGTLSPGPFSVGFRRETVRHEGRTTLVDTWYPAGRGGTPMDFGAYLRLSTDLRDAPPGFPDDPAALAATLATAITGSPDGIGPGVAREILASPMAAMRDAPAAPGAFPLVLWAPRYATTSAQSVLSEYVASLGFVVAFPRPEAGARLPFELETADAKVAELQARVTDMQTALGHLQTTPQVNAARVGVLAWSYTGEVAARFAAREPRVGLVAGLSTNLLDGWVFDPGAVAGHTPQPTAAYALLTQLEDPPRPRAAAPGPIAAYYPIDFPGLAHGSFNTLEGYLPSRLGIARVQRWSRSSPAGVAGYEAAAVILGRLLRHHVESASPRPLGRVQLTTGIQEGILSSRF
jgi:dienelactone hydrolase